MGTQNGTPNFGKIPYPSLCLTASVYPSVMAHLVAMDLKITVIVGAAKSYPVVTRSAENCPAITPPGSSTRMLPVLIPASIELLQLKFLGCC